jgi:hypothetical protein
MPPMSPPGHAAGGVFLRVGDQASVVSSRPAIDAAFCSAVRVTLVGSMMPALTRSLVLAGGGVVAVRCLLGRDLGWTTIEPSTPALLAIWRSGLLEGAADDVDADGGLVALELSFSSASGAQQGDAAAGDDALLDGRAGGVQGVLDAGLLLLHLGLGGGADVDDGHAAGQLGQALLELLAVVVAGGGLLDLGADLAMRPLMSAFLPAPSTMVVLSLSMTTFLALPRSAS